MTLVNRVTNFGTEDLDISLDKKSGKYRYKVFGLNIASDIQIPELLIDPEATDSPQVNIILGEVPVSISEPIEKTEIYQLAANQFLFRVPGVGCYFVTKGNSIVIQPAEQANERSVRLFLLGTAFGGLLMQRGILPIHGSAVVSNEGCVIFTGVSGAGKSTLLAAFREQGYFFLTDDVAAVTLDADGVPWVHSAYPQQNLWRDTSEIMGVDTTSLTPFYIGVERDKFAVPIHKGFWHLPVPLAAIYELRVGKCRDVTLRRITGVDKLAVLMNHIYRPWLIEGLGLKSAHFQRCATVARQVAVSSLSRPEGVFSTEEQIRLVQQDIVRLLAGGQWNISKNGGCKYEIIKSSRA